MAGSATVQVLGNLAADPEVKFGEDGKQRARFRVLVSTGKRDAEVTTGFDVVVFGKQAELVGTYLAKGRQVLVSGRIEKARGYTLKSGDIGAGIDVIADNVTFVGSKGDAPAKASAPAAGGPSDEDLPF